MRRRAARLLVGRSHWLSRRYYSSSGLHQLYCAYVVHPNAPSRRSTARQSVALALAVRPVTASRGATTRRPDCTGSTAPMSCIRTCRLATRLLVGRSHWLSPCVWSLHLAARLLVVRIASALLRLCRAFGRAVSPPDFSSDGCTGSRRASGHCVLLRDYSSSGLHRLYGAYVVYPDAPSRRLTSRQSVALSLAVCPVIPLCRDYPSRSCNGYTSATPCDQVPWHVTRLVVDYFTYAARPGASACRAARCTARRAALSRVLRIRHASGCLGSSRRSSSTTSTTPRVRVPCLVARFIAPLVVDYFAYTVRPGASARRAARCRLLRLCRASGCLGTSHGSSWTTSPCAGSSSTTSPTLRVRLPRLVARLVVDYFDYAACSSASARRAARRQLL
jgi:hypothetical protein